MPAGSYSTCFEWHAHTYGTADQYGQKVDTLTSQGNVWGRFGPASSSREDYLGSDTNTQYATAYIREFLSIRAKDTLTDLEFDEAWEVVSVSRDNDAYETVAEVRRRR